MILNDISISEYEKAIVDTDELPPEKIRPVVMGLYGEVGSIMATSKKLHREGGDVFTAFTREAREELGDTLWYLAALCRRLGISLESIVAEVISSHKLDKKIIAGSTADSPIAEVRQFPSLASIDEVLVSLGQAASNLLTIELDDPDAKDRIVSFVASYLMAVQANKISLAQIIKENVEKARGSFLKPTLERLPTFDEDFPSEEKLPENFEIEITQRASGKSYLRMNGVYIGDPLTDNHRDKDGYRFHDVFHLAHAAVLHWSPVFRALIRHKRKSKAEIDEAEDSGRPIVIEEGLTAYVFSYAKDLNYFEGQGKISLGLLKTVRNFVRGYEVDVCPYKLWEDAILQGYDVFRQVRAKEGGTIVGDRKRRRLEFKG